LDKFPQINLRWLFTGKGPIERSELENEESLEGKGVITSDGLRMLLDRQDSLARENGQLKAEFAALTSENEALKEEIANLKNRVGKQAGVYRYPIGNEMSKVAEPE
jgi:predicted RNase H-like nuclease (RuvC/YqgF family)